ncbi:hypothetical protein PPYR_03475 [Photinus pyralis]|uniref:DUF4200 domain-containing protein n=1 Tax=Photinus pyralis TaxID=7054 RepID=A0A5N4A2X2_PHOPY|nr:cilia- and flagella-associated protein 73-like [Photinus pyralis]XP_031331991.1 cilia- and flagella-associated protein 73-like [Photinus pyralis]KAB0791675.1 hypothetical protein PPYR_03475 [Photinus pyralis]
MYYTELENELTFPQISPEKTIGDFLESKLNERVLKKYPEWDFPRVEPKIALAALQRDLDDSEQRLTEKREEAKSSKAQLDNEWKSLEEEGLKLRKTFCDFDKMIKENAEKTARATSKTKRLIISKANTDNAIKQTENDHNKLLKVKDEMEQQIRDHQIYESYLEVVSETNKGEFPTAQDVFNKFAILDEARNVVTKRLEHNIRALEETKDRMEQQLIDQSTVLIGLNNRVAALNDRFRAANAKCEKWEGVVRTAQVSLRDRLLDILSTRRVCWNLYLNMCRRRKTEPRIRKSDLEAQLWYIKRHLRLLGTTIRIADKMAADAEAVEKTKSRK